MSSGSVLSYGGCSAATCRGAFVELIDRPVSSDAVGAAAFADAARAALSPSSRPVGTSSTDDALRNPYRGLRAFTEADAPDFFGRTASVRQVIERLEESVPDARFVAVVGPSGCGKSSLVRAGVVPALRDGVSDAPILVTVLSPGPADPHDELEAAMARVSVRAVRRMGDVLRRSPRGSIQTGESSHSRRGGR